MRADQGPTRTPIPAGPHADRTTTPVPQARAPQPVPRASHDSIDSPTTPVPRASHKPTPVPKASPLGTTTPVPQASHRQHAHDDHRAADLRPSLTQTLHPDPLLQHLPVPKDSRPPIVDALPMVRIKLRPPSEPIIPRIDSDPMATVRPAPQPAPAQPAPPRPAAHPAPAPRPALRDPAPVPKASPPADPSARRFLLTLLAFALPLLAALAWSLQDDEPLPPPSARRPSSNPGASDDAPGPAPVVIRPQAPAVAVSVTVDPPRRLGRLSQLVLGVLDGDGRLADTRLTPALGRKISVVNVWATYCAPCMRELPRLLDALAARPWGNDLRLVPVLLEAPDRQNQPQQAAMRALRASPATRQLLVDLTPAGALQTLLHDAGLLPERATLPLTLVLDCEQQVRWLHRGELTDTAALGAVLDDLRDELPRCSEPAPEPALADGCGNGTCEPEFAEDCSTCPRDCGCPENRECVVVPGGRAQCPFRSQGLKD